ncbi:PAN domain containing protein 2, partial [Sarcoptes scabiei]
MTFYRINNSNNSIVPLSDCIDRCRKNSTCKALNFETGLCVLLTTAANQQTTVLTPSQFPVFTIFAQKICIDGNYQQKCRKGWAFERVLGFELRDKERKMLRQVPTRLACMQACLAEKEFECRSVNFDPDNGDCSLSDMDRGSIVPTHDLKMRTYGPSSSGSLEYIENNCIEEPKKLCDFRVIEGKILKTVDFVYQNINSVDECREKCLSSPYRCHSFDLGDPNNPNHVCRTSHLDKYSLAHIEDAYLQVPGAITYELHSCYNVSIVCRSREMIARIQTTKVFDGKVYAKTRPNLCVEDIQNSLDFEIRMKYHDIDCDVKEVQNGHFSNDIVIQHHDMIVTTKDLGLSIHCHYDLSNRSITNNVNLAVDG